MDRCTANDARRSSRILATYCAVGGKKMAGRQRPDLRDHDPSGVDSRARVRILLGRQLPQLDTQLVWVAATGHTGPHGAGSAVVSVADLAAGDPGAVALAPLAARTTHSDSRQLRGLGPADRIAGSSTLRARIQPAGRALRDPRRLRSEEHTSELQSLMRT